MQALQSSRGQGSPSSGEELLSVASGGFATGEEKGLAGQQVLSAFSLQVTGLKVAFGMSVCLSVFIFIF